MSLISKSEFVGLDGVTHLCTGGEAPWLRAHTAACERFGALKSAGMVGREEMFVIGERARTRAARLLGLKPLLERGELAENAREHLVIVDLIEARDSAGVQAALSRHIGQVMGKWRESPPEPAHSNEAQQ